MAPKKSVKMDLGSFLADDSLGGGSWADEEVDMSSIGVPVAPSAQTGALNKDQGFTRVPFRDEESRRQEFPIPDSPPYRARVGNLSWEVSEGALVKFFEDRLNATEAITDIKLPDDPATGRLKGFGFITFSTRDLLQEALNLSLAEFLGRRIYVNVAAPPKLDVFDMDWRAARNAPAPGRGERGERGERRERREEPDLDWGSARTSSGGLPPRERSSRGEGRPRREEPVLDWGSARSTVTTLPPREKSDRGERRPRKEEPEFDWSTARSSQATLPPRERSNRTRRTPKKDDSDSLDWSAVRGSGVKNEKSSSKRDTRKSVKEQNKKDEDGENGPQNSLFHVLSVEDESDDEDNKPTEEKKEINEDKKVTNITESTSNLDINGEKDSASWNVVGK